MNITVSKVIRKLEKEYGWENTTKDDELIWFVKELIKDTLSIIDEELMNQKGISIKKRK